MARYIDYGVSIFDTEQNIWIPKIPGTAGYDALLESGVEIEPFTASFEEAKANKISEIVTAYNYQLQEGITVPAGVMPGEYSFATDCVSRSKIFTESFFATRQDPEDTYKVETEDHEYVLLTQEQIVYLSDYLQLFMSYLLDLKNQLIDTINTALTVEQLADIHWNSEYTLPTVKLFTPPMTSESDPLYTVDKPEIAMKYHTETGEPITGNLSMVYKGLDMSGATLVFSGSTYVHNDAPIITFSDNSCIGFDNTGKYSHFRKGDQSVIKILFYVTWQEDFYTLGENMIVLSVTNNQNKMSEDITFSTTVMDTVVDPEYNFHTKTNETDFVMHRTTDKNRWQDAWNTQAKTYELIAESKGLKLDPLHTQTITTATSTTPFIVPDQNGGIIDLVSSNPGNLYAELFINGVSAYTTEGMISGIQVAKVFPVNYNDQVYATNVDTLIYEPYIADENSTQQKMVNKINQLQLTTVDLQNQIYDLQASISNKTIADQDPIDITNQTYIVNNELGARLSGQGIRTIGLLGVTVLSTGTVDVNGTEVYNNTSLLGIGDPEVLSINVADGTTITSSGMSYVHITNYVVGTI